MDIRCCDLCNSVLVILGSLKRLSSLSPIKKPIPHGMPAYLPGLDLAGGALNVSNNLKNYRYDQDLFFVER